MLVDPNYHPLSPILLLLPDRYASATITDRGVWVDNENKQTVAFP